MFQTTNQHPRASDFARVAASLYPASSNSGAVDTGGGATSDPLLCVGSPTMAWVKHGETPGPGTML